MAKKEIGDLEQIRSNLEAWLARKLDAAVTLETPAFPEASGESSVTLLLQATCDGRAQRFVCRMKPLQDALFDDYDLLLQYQLMQLAGNNGVPVPDLVDYEGDASLVGCDFYMMHFTDGLIPADNPPYAFGSWVTELSATERERMWRNGLEALARIHNIDMSQHELPSLPQAHNTQSVVQHELDKFDALVDAATRDSIAPVVLDALEELKANAPKDGPLRLCWGDSRVGNVIWQDLKPAAIIDWEMASLCDPLMDVSWWYWIDYVNSVGLGVERLSGLPDRPELYQQWQQLTGLPINNSLYYDLFNVVRYAIILEKKFLEAGLAADMGGAKSFASAFVPPMLEEYRAG